MSQLPSTAWSEIENYVTWSSLGALIQSSCGRRRQAMLEALRRVINGDLLPLSRVVIHGLQRVVNLNGARGLCWEFDKHTGHWLVMVGAGNIKRVRPENLRTIGRISRPMARVGSSRGSRQISAALPALIHAMQGPYKSQVQGMFNEQLMSLFSTGQGGVMLAFARIAGVEGPPMQLASPMIQQKACWELSHALRDACEQKVAPCRAHVLALVNARADVNCGTGTRTPLESLISNFKDLDEFLGTARLLSERGSVARGQYIIACIMKVSVDLNLSQEDELQWKYVCKSFIKNRYSNPTARICAEHRQFRAWHNNMQHVLKAKEHLEGVRYAITAEQREAHEASHEFQLMAIDDMIAAVDRETSRWEMTSMSKEDHGKGS